VKGYAQARYLAEGACDSKDTPAPAAGQKLTVTMQSANPSAYFNISAPGQAPVAMFNGSMGGKFEQVMLPDDGEYLVMVCFMRSAARRGASAKFTLSIELEGKSLTPVPAAQDALVRGTRFHATAPIPCTPPFGLKLACEAGVVRRANGAATVDIRMGPELRRRTLFAGGKPVASDATGAMKAVRKGDITVVTMDDESYSIPDALISGG